MEKTKLVILLGSLFVVLIVTIGGIIILRVQNRRAKLHLKLQREEALRELDVMRARIETQEFERMKLGMELHDDLGPTFSALKFGLEVLSRKIHHFSPKMSKEVDTYTVDLEKSILKVKDISRMLYPAVLKNHGLLSALEDLRDSMNDSDGLKISLDISADKDLDKDLELNLFRICSELINNGKRHSGADQMIIKMKAKVDLGEIIYTDTGKGFVREAIDSNVGLSSIESRVLQMNGHVDYFTDSDERFNIQITYGDNQTSDSRGSQSI